MFFSSKEDFNYIDSKNHKYIFRVCKGSEDFIITIDCITNVELGEHHGYVMSLKQFLSLPDSRVSEEAKQVVLKYIKNLVFI
jgi:hypothetical protein